MRLPLLSTAIVLATLLGTPVMVSAQTIQVTGQIIVVTAKVESNIFVVVDGTGRISQIFSNSDTRVEPTFVSNSLNGTVITVGPSVRASYDSLMSNRAVTYGSLYERQRPIAPQLSVLMSQSTATINAWNNR